jgi:hypothetical protein
MSTWFLIAATVLMLASLTLVYLDWLVWKKSPRHLGEVLQVLAVAGMAFLVLSIFTW